MIDMIPAGDRGRPGTTQPPSAIRTAIALLSNRRAPAPPKPAEAPTPRAPAVVRRGTGRDGDGLVGRHAVLPALPAPPQHGIGRPRTRWLVEEAEEVSVRALVQLRETGRVSPIYPVTGRVQWVTRAENPTAPLVRPEPVFHLLGGRPSPRPRLYVRCPRCGARRSSLFALQGVVGCRGCLGLRYQSQGKGQWSPDLLRRMTARLQALRRRPGPKGRRCLVWQRRLDRTAVVTRQWLQRFDERQGPVLRAAGSSDVRPPAPVLCAQLSAAGRLIRRLS